MFDGGEEPEREIPLRITNVDLAKLVKEQMAESRVVREENRTMKRELDRLKNKMRKGSDDELEPEEIVRNEEQEKNPANQRPFLVALERVGKKREGDLPTFHGKLDPDERMDWVEALDNHFECDKTPKNQKVRIAKAKLKGPTLSWWKFLQNEMFDENNEHIAT